MRPLSLEVRTLLYKAQSHILTICLAIESETESLTWAAAGQNVTLYLTAVDPVHINIGSVLCPPSDVIPLAMSFTARIIVFDIQVPITAGASVSEYQEHWGCRAD